MAYTNGNFIIFYLFVQRASATISFFGGATGEVWWVVEHVFLCGASDAGRYLRDTGICCLRLTSALHTYIANLRSADHV